MGIHSMNLCVQIYFLSSCPSMERIVTVYYFWTIALCIMYKNSNKYTQVLTHYLPPYSPDYNPIELAFSKVKYSLKAMEAEMQALQDIDTILLAAFPLITPADCCAWINSVGIY